jgi:hypothetical protein
MLKAPSAARLRVPLWRGGILVNRVERGDHDMLYTFAKLDETQLTAVQQLERNEGL